ncbi:FHA domain-containing protein PS1 [Sesamum angolense]|uniref:FHA domain-containing protein PS1 n=1 Tax=Sesamum angolense TaxID=2727404 RepID=A0AAE1WD61_9LAMI|nr:FHA domain-containing protein PS1 [Sesamum angolense]
MKNTGELEEVKHPMSYRSSPLKSTNNSKMYQYEPMLPTLDKAGQHRHVLQEWRPISHGRSKKQPVVLKARADRDPFNPLSVNSTSNKNKAISNLQFMRTPRENNTMKVVKNRWIIVVDTACLLNKKSRKELQLLQGLRGTTLVIPRIVVRELDCMLRRGSFFTRMTEVSAALQWIEECMAVAKWWIHIQSSADESQLIPPTPPASPHWSSEDKGAFPVGSISFSPYSLQEIVTPTAADHILECALFFKQTRNNGQLVLLSDDVTLKIKAMAEGVICETAQEFRGSLVNPFSSRFLYSDSSPIGPTWSCVDDVVLKEKYYPSPSKKLSKSGEGAKGLKLILLHNSKFRQINPVSPNPLAESRSLISNLGSN